MKISNITLVNMINLLTNYESMKLPQKISYAITKNQINANKEYQVYDKQLQKLNDSYAVYCFQDNKGNIKKKENGVPLFKEECSNKAEEYANELTELLNLEFDFNCYYIEPEIFNYEDNDKFDALSARDIIILQSILCKNEKEKKEIDKNE